MITNKIRFATLTIWLLGSGAAHATLLPSEELFRPCDPACIGGGAAASGPTYDADTLEYQSLVAAPEIPIGDSDQAPTLLEDWSFRASALIDNNGGVLSGAGVFLGGSPDLGIASGSILMTGNLSSVAHITGGDYLHFLYDVTYSHPFLADFWGNRVGHVIYSSFDVPSEITNLWSSSWAGTAWTADTWTVRAIPVPEPSMLGLMLLGAAVLSSFQPRWRTMCGPSALARRNGSRRHIAMKARYFGFSGLFCGILSRL